MIELKRVYKRYEDKGYQNAVLKNINLTIEPKRFYRDNWKKWGW
ncbi:hypothetical protein [Listeria fleischmannii]|uniref:Uncharacterized protein n=1 Tax=Listeria fleischmannii FSL S10-1203 TaxID=1265822 RepID=W7DX52_9LIST|nr:hypothetical protein [Listeria fleischmannii]EUJ52980.1 hypothetical protein MCOL2_11972 [Listeria fleischmannii FSL S10-1203]